MTLSIDDWFATELAKSMTLRVEDTGGLLLGIPVWGPTYISRLERFVIPSLLAPANAQALRKMKARLVLFTDPDGLVPLWRVTAPLEAAGIPAQIFPMPREILDGGRLHKFEVLGAVQNIHLQWARRAGEAYSMICCDHAYSERYFEVLEEKRKSHPAIAHGAVSIDLEASAAELDACRHDDGSLRVSAEKLGDIGFRCLHQQMHACLRLPDAPLRMSQTLIWPGRDALHFAGPIFNPVYMSPRLVRESPVLYPTTFDAELPLLMPKGFHIPGPSDGMVLVEVSDRDKGMAQKAPSLEHWVGFAWAQMNYDEAFLPIYRRRTVIPHAGDPEGLTDAEIERQHANIMTLIEGSHYGALKEGFKQQTKSRHARPFLRCSII